MDIFIYFASDLSFNDYHWGTNFIFFLSIESDLTINSM